MATKKSSNEDDENANAFSWLDEANDGKHQATFSLDRAESEPLLFGTGIIKFGGDGEKEDRRAAVAASKKQPASFYGALATMGTEKEDASSDENNNNHEEEDEEHGGHAWHVEKDDADDEDEAEADEEGSAIGKMIEVKKTARLKGDDNVSTLTKSSSVSTTAVSSKKRSKGKSKSKRKQEKQQRRLQQQQEQVSAPVITKQASGGRSMFTAATTPESVLQDEHEPEEPVDHLDDDDDEDEEQHMLRHSLLRPHAPRQNPCLWIFRALNGSAAVSAVCLLLTQIAPLIFKGNFDDDDAASAAAGGLFYSLSLCLKLYITLFCILIFLVELEVPIPAIRTSALLQNYFSRGFFYSFLGLVCTVESVSDQVSTLVVLQSMEDSGNSSGGGVNLNWAALFMQVSAWFMCAVGCVYMTLGLCCLHRLRDRIRDDEKEVWRKYRVALREWKHQRALYPRGLPKHTASEEQQQQQQHYETASAAAASATSSQKSQKSKNTKKKKTKTKPQKDAVDHHQHRKQWWKTHHDDDDDDEHGHVV